MLLTQGQLIKGQVAASLVLCAVGLCTCYVWDYILREYDAAHFFEGKDATFDMLGLAVGYTYVGIVRDFISTITERSKVLARVQLKIAQGPEISREVLRQLLRGEGETTKVPAQWQGLAEALYIREHTDSTVFYNTCGPYACLFIYFGVHPPLTHTGEATRFWGWATVYTLSVTVLFAFILNLWWQETYILPTAFHDASILSWERRYESSISVPIINRRVVVGVKGRKLKFNEPRSRYGARAGDSKEYRAAGP